MDIQCKECGLVLTQTEGKRPRYFCDSTHRSNFWQKEKRRVAAEKAKKQGKSGTSKKPANTTKKGNNQKDEAGNNNQEVGKHKLWKEGDPKENSMAFYMKYDCYNYSELENKKK